MKPTLAFALLIALASVLASGISRTVEKPSQQSQRFIALGDLAGGAFSSTAYGVSADGSVVVGCSNSENGAEAFRWTERGCMVGLGFAEASAANDDGSAVVGFRLVGGGSEPVCWMQNGGLQGLGNIAPRECGHACGVSADGSIIVGSCASRLAFRDAAFRWTPTSGVARLAAFPNGVIEAEAYAVSSDGSVLVGAMCYESGRRVAFRWASKLGYIDLGVPPGDCSSIAHAVSTDGSVVVGLNESSGTAFRWTQETGMVDLGTLPGGSHSCAFGVSADGSVIVGQSGGAIGPEAFIWDANHGMRRLRQLLAREPDLEPSLRRWKLRSATAVSRDGSVIVGFGINPSGNREAWIARLGDQPSTDEPVLRIATR